MSVVSFNDNLKIGKSLFHIQTEYYKNKEQVICNIFQNGKVIKKIPLQVEVEEGIEEMVREFHLFVLNRFKNPDQFKVIVAGREAHLTEQQSNKRIENVELNFLNKSVAEIDRDFFAFLHWLSKKKETIILGIKCDNYNGYLSFLQGEPVGFKCGKVIGYKELQMAINKKPHLVKIIKCTNSINKQFCFSLDVLFNTNAQDNNDFLILKAQDLLNDLSKIKGFISLMVLDNASHIRWGFQEKHLDIDLETLRNFYLERIKKSIRNVPSEFLQIVLMYEKYVFIFDFLKDNDDFLLAVFDCKGNYGLAQKKIREAFASKKI